MRRKRKLNILDMDWTAYAPKNLLIDHHLDPSTLQSIYVDAGLLF
jgi:hypothetical protein